MILTKEIKIKVWGQNVKYFRDLGYSVKHKDIIKIPVEHLQKNSQTKLKVKCDICGKEKEIYYQQYIINTKNNIIKYTCSQKCAHSAGKNKQTNLKRYGNENFTNQEKREQTNLKKYGACHNWAKIKGKERTCDKTIKEKYGVDNVFQSEQIKELSKQTKLKKYGNKNYFNIKQARKTWLKNLGVNHPMKNEKIKQLSKSTKKERYGDENYVNPEKAEATRKERYGVSHHLQLSEFREKQKNTNLKKYGVEYTHQNIDIFEKSQKSGFKFKNYKLPSGKTVKIQGFENLALDVLLKHYKEIDLLIENKDIEKYIGQIWYFDKNNKKHRYLPDIYIITQNKIVEVKSDWTYKRDIDKNLLKERGCLIGGFNFEFMVFNGRKKLLTENEIKLLA